MSVENPRWLPCLGPVRALVEVHGADSRQTCEVEELGEEEDADRLVDWLGILYGEANPSAEAEPGGLRGLDGEEVALVKLLLLLRGQEVLGKASDLIQGP